MSASQFDHLSAGWQTTCVIFNEQLQCFGWNQYGQVGVGSTSDQYFAADVIVPSVDSVAPGVVHTCAITTEKDLFCWGSNDSVNILINDESSDVPVLADVEGSVLKVASGRSHICAIVKKAEAMFLCWGDNEFGMLGTNSTTTAFEPVGVQWDDIPKSIAAGYYHSCAISSRDNTLW
jgi:alpha-tubulin suppressor-like RCC1 family protein